MTVSSSQSKVSYAGDGAATEFAIPFAFVLNADIAVVKAATDGSESDWAEGTHYTLSGAGNPAGGSLMVVTAPTDHTPAVGETLTIKRVVALTQETEYPEGGEFPAQAHEQALDKLTHAAQQLDEKLSRAIKLPETAATEDLAIPVPEAAKLLRWNQSASAIENVDVSSLGTIVLSDDTPQAGTTNGVAGSSASVSRADHAHPLPVVGPGLTRAGDQLAVDFAFVEAADPDIVKADQSGNLEVGFTSSVHAHGAVGSGTVALDLTQPTIQTATVAGNFTLAAPSSGNGYLELKLTNDGAGGHVLTLTGFTTLSGTYNDAASAVNLFRVSRIDGANYLEIVNVA